MRFIAEIDIMPHKELLDPQGKAVSKNMMRVGINDIEDIRIGKHIMLTLQAADEADAREQVETACKKLLANVIMESYTFSLHSAE
jgi:phosphoribosylformylglycinamidine synthase